MITFAEWVEQQRLKGFLEHSIGIGDVEAAWNAALSTERAVCAAIVRRYAAQGDWDKDTCEAIAYSIENMIEDKKAISEATTV